MAAGSVNVGSTPARRLVATEDVIGAYQQTGSVWRAAKQLGITGQAVHERLGAIGYPMRARHWTAAERRELQELAEQGVPLGEVARRLGRPFAGVATKAARLGISSRVQREQKLPRGQGFDKQSTLRHMLNLEHLSDMTVTQYARKNGLHVDLLVQALERHALARWKRYVAANAKLPMKRCGYCEQDFYPNSARQQYCSRQHAAHARADRRYFGGRRRAALGLDAGICQLCSQQPRKGLSAHHVLGKENDPDNDLLIALCAGCHQLVSQLAARTFVNDSRGWERLISLVWMRRNADQFASFGNEMWELYVEVIIEREPIDADDDTSVESGT